MFRPAPIRAALRHVSIPASRTGQHTTRRCASTVPADKPRSWRSGLLRWTAAGAIVYYYNTTNIFAGSAPLNAEPSLSTPPPPTLDSITAERRQRAAAATISEPPKSDAAALASSGALDEIPTTGNETAAAPVQSPTEGGSMSPDELEQEAGQEGAFNPETGEINWDCPCLGGMAHGPCGDQFKAAFSCFVFSKEEPKGVDCIDKFKNMQDCFREHPDIYGAELDSDDDDDEVDPALEADIAAADAKAKDSKTAARPVGVEERSSSSSAAKPAEPQQPASSSKSPETPSKSVASSSVSSAKAASLGSQRTAGDSPGGATSESDELVPKAAHDARG